MRFSLPVPGPDPRVADRAQEAGRWRSARPRRGMSRRDYHNWVANTTGADKRTRGQGQIEAVEVTPAMEARDLLVRGLASPGGYAAHRPWDLGTVHRYLAVENEFRRLPDATWDRGEWRSGTPEGRDYRRYLDKMQEARALGARSLKEFLDSHRGPFDREGLEAAYRQAKVRGDFSFEETQLEVSWRALRRVALAMGGLSQTQYQILVPQVPCHRATEELLSLERSGCLARVGERERGLPPRWVVSAEESLAAIAVGDLAPNEWDAQASLRGIQRAHDEAVGDAMLLLAMGAQEIGLSVDYVVPESRLLAEGHPAPCPDFVFGIQNGIETFDLGVEVVGVGGNYRKAGFASEAKAAGHILYYPPYLGGVGRFA